MILRNIGGVGNSVECYHKYWHNVS